MLNNKFLIKSSETARQALRQINFLGKVDAVLFVVDNNNKVLGSVTDGDIRRGLLRDLNIDESVENFMNKKFHFFKENTYNRSTFSRFKNLNLSYVPLLGEDEEIVKIIEIKNVRSVLPIDAIIMAGGRGERLRPLTDRIPKPLLNVGSKPIIEHNIDRLTSYGVKHFYITLGYLSTQIKNHLKNKYKREIELKYIVERKALGTAGAASLIKKFENNYVLLINADLLTNIDYEDLYNVFEKSGADMAVATIPYEVSIPYAVMDIDKANTVLGFKEKPKYTYYSNGGIYLFNKKLLKHLPYNQRFDMTEFMEKLLSKKYKIITFPIIGYWLDIGKTEDYLRAQQDIHNIKL